MLKSYLHKNRVEAGCDEAGRGCLAGPVFAAAVILPGNIYHEGLNDSKKLSVKQRLELRDYIETHALCYGIASADHKEIDEINILNASYLAMHRALEKLGTVPEHILVDGNRFKAYRKIPHTTVVKGDEQFLSIAAASILAKTYRDDYMRELHVLHPEYNWAKNKGYPTAEHRRALHDSGVSPYHRKSFRLLPLQYRLDFQVKSR
jgi:ribonuclease HII